MQKQNKQKNKKLEEKEVDNDDVTINLKESSIAEFTKRPLPTDREAKKFEEYIDSEAKREEASDFSHEDPDFNEEEIDESLNEIYQDDKGGMVNVKKLTVLILLVCMSFALVLTGCITVDDVTAKTEEVAEDFANLLSAVTGWELTDQDILTIGERIYNTQRLIMEKLGIKDQDTLPERILKDPLPDGPSKGEICELDKMLGEYYKLRGWDEHGIPTPNKIKELGIDDFKLLI